MRATPFRTTLVPGKKPPYSSWTFVVIPAEIARQWGPGPLQVRGTIAGRPFEGTASKGDGVLRVPVPKPFQRDATIARGDTVDVALEIDPRPRPVDIPTELQAVFEKDPELAGLFEQLPPAHRRAWASYVREAKRPETRERRARKAPDGIRARAFPRQR